MAARGAPQGESGKGSTRLSIFLAVLAVVGTAAAGIGGAAIGGWIANEGAKEIQEEEAKREGVREEKEVRGAARLLMEELTRVRAQVLRSATAASWLPLDYQVHIRREDHRLLVANMSPDQWAPVINALGDIATLPAVQRDGFEWKQGADKALALGSRDLSEVGSKDMEYVVFVAGLAKQAIEALKHLAGAGLVLEPEPRRVAYREMLYVAPP